MLTVVVYGTSLKVFPEIIRRDRDPTMSLSGKSTGRQTIYAAAAVDGRRRPLNLYEVLKVKHNASQTEIKTAYRALAKIYHPDVAAAAVFKNPEESFCRDFIEIHSAYATLSDPATRDMYDFTLRMGSSRSPEQPLESSSSSKNYWRARFYSTRRWETDQCW